MGRAVVITGGTGGIGLHSAIGLARAGARVVVTGRSRERGEQALERIRAESGSQDVALVLGDLSDRAGVAALGDAILAEHPRIDILVHNAGMMAQERTVNSDGHELDFAVNVVAPHALTHHLLPALTQAPSRVLVVTGGKPSGPFDPSDLQSEKSFVPLVNYTMTKRAAEAMSIGLAEELEGRGVDVVVVYPGRASTAMTQAMTPSSLPWYLRPAWPVFRVLVPKDDGGKSAALAARSTVFAALSKSLAGRSWSYIDTHSQPGTLHPTVHEAGNRAIVMRALSPGATSATAR